MKITEYVVVDPPTREELEDRIFNAIQSRQLVRFTLRELGEVEGLREVEVGIRQTAHELDLRFFSGFFIEGTERFVINIYVPQLQDEVATARVAPDTSNEEGN
jgi:hypothetical protein